MNDWVKDVPVDTTVLCRTDGLREAFTRLANLWETDPRGWFYLRDGVTCLRALLAAHPAPTPERSGHDIACDADYLGASCICDEISPEEDGHVCTPHCDTDQGHYPAPTPDTRREDVALVETAARALYEVSPWVHDGVEIPWGDLTALGKDAFRDRARAVLAVLPAPPVVDEASIRERIAQDIEAQAYDADGARTAISTGECTVEGVDTWDEAMYLAARIARGATR